MLIDSHIHLDDPIFTVNSSLEKTLDEARAHHICHWIIPGTVSSSFERIFDIISNNTGCYAAYGLHPYFMMDHSPESISKLENALIHYQPVAIGECGIDLMIPNPSLEDQLNLFKIHLSLAKTFNLPMIIHARKSIDIILKELRKHPNVTGVFHAFSGSLQQANQCIELGYKIGIGGNITYPRAKKLRHILASIPLESILLETDAPFQKKDLLGIAQEVAKIRQQSYEHICKETTKNSMQLFNLKEF